MIARVRMSAMAWERLVMGELAILAGALRIQSGLQSSSLQMEDKHATLSTPKSVIGRPKFGIDIQSCLSEYPIAQGAYIRSVHMQQKFCLDRVLVDDWHVVAE